ncbi:hypothetical protein [Yoonia sp.]|uniref:hypothetical protein n=1 Tax=Yoonia sp. TaxID=2212373 RepID=UPI0040488269
MANTKISTMLATTAALALAACGGGSSDISNNPTATTAVQTLKAYSDGSGVISASPNLGSAGGPSNLIIAASDLTAAREVASGTINLVEVPGASATFGQYYVVQRTGTASNGASLVVSTAGESLNIQGSEYAAVSLVEINNAIAISSSGSKVNGMPSGNYTYTGPASVMSGPIGDGTFTMNANFNTNTGNIAATIPANSPAGSGNPGYFFSSNTLQINQTDGSFSSSDAAIGSTGVNSYSSSIKGYFAGTNATGVHGLIYTNDPSAATYLGAFYGSR